MNVHLVLAPAFALKVDRIGSYNFNHRFITIVAQDHWSIVPSVIDLLIKIASGALVIVGWQVKHFLIMYDPHPEHRSMSASVGSLSK
jgi:hypothetical protein